MFHSYLKLPGGKWNIIYKWWMFSCYKLSTEENHHPTCLTHIPIYWCISHPKDLVKNGMWDVDCRNLFIMRGCRKTKYQKYDVLLITLPIILLCDAHTWGYTLTLTHYFRRDPIG